MSHRAERYRGRRHTPAVVVALDAPCLADRLLTPEQRAASPYDVFLTREQVARGRQLLHRGAWSLGALSWYNITLLEE